MLPSVGVADDYLLQTRCLEYQVTDRLDGVEPAPLYSTDPRSPLYVRPDAQGKLIFEVARLGRVDLTGASEGATADRIVKWILLLAPVPAAVLQVNADIAFPVGPTDKQPLARPVGALGIYSRICIPIPQSGQLFLNNMRSDGVTPVLVRIGVSMPDIVSAYAEIGRACCCLGATLDELGQPFFTRAIYADCSRTINDIDPNPVFQGDGEVVLTLNGSGFTEGDLVLIEDGDGNPLTVVSIEFFGSDEIGVTVNVAADQPIGDYTVFVVPPLANAGCGGTITLTVQGGA